MAKVYDVVATVGTYQKDGETKYISKNIGEIFETKNGLAMKIDATFNPAGCTKTDDGKVWLKLFEPRHDSGHQAGQQSGQGRAPQPPVSDFDDENIPF